MVTSIQDLEVGQCKELRVSVPADAIAQFVTLSGDGAPLHTDAEFAKKAGYDGPVVHGAYLAALISRFVGMEFPGSRSVLERMDLSFRGPCYAPTELTITGTVKQVSEAVSSVALTITVQNPEGIVLVSGKTWHRIS